MLLYCCMLCPTCQKTNFVIYLSWSWLTHWQRDTGERGSSWKKSITAVNFTASQLCGTYGEPTGQTLGLKAPCARNLHNATTGHFHLSLHLFYFTPVHSFLSMTIPFPYLPLPLFDIYASFPTSMSICACYVPFHLYYLSSPLLSPYMFMSLFLFFFLISITPFPPSIYSTLSPLFISFFPYHLHSPLI